MASAGLALGLVGAIVLGGVARAEAAGPPVTYLVQLVDNPVAGYAGGRPDLAPTRPRHGARLDRSSVAVRRYRDYLDRRRNEVLRRLPGVQPLYVYRWTVNGFAAALTPDQAAAVRRTSGVRLVTRDTVHHLDSVSSGPAGTDEFLGLPAAWRSLGGSRQAGAGVVIGVVDSGIWPEHPSFAGSRPAPAHPFTGSCVGFKCGGAVVGARWYLNGLGVGMPVDGEFRSPRDHAGHGTHVAAVAAGDDGVPAAVGPRRNPTLGTVAGVAPAADLAVYKSCWSVAGGESCAGSDTVAAVDQAVADGVDVLNISVSGASGGSPDTDPMAAALFGAAEAGVFVAASAGNGGPDPMTAHGQPWLTTVGAGTFDRRPVGVVRLGNGVVLSGAGLGAGVASRPLVSGAGAGSRRCSDGRLDPTKVRGAIVVCVRGGTARTAKSAEVARVGGVGMILANPGLDEVDADQHAVPTVHIDSTSYEKLASYLESGHPTASLEPARMRSSGTGGRPEVAEFSARGPDGDVLAPDLIAPGVDVPAGISPAEDGSMFALLSGTSVATPQVAAAAALVRSRWPDWTPMDVKSALLTTASTTDAQGAALTTVDSELAGPAEYGAGALSVLEAVHPGLVFGSTPPDWAHSSAVNSPAVAVGALAGVQIVRRTVTNVGDTTASYVAHVEPPPGVDVVVSPARLTVAPGASATFAVEVHRISAPYDQLASGSITWTDGRHSVRMPIAVRPVVVNAFAGSGLSGPLRIVPGFSGQLRARLAGPVPAAPHLTWLHRPSGHDAVVTVDVASHTALARFATSAADFPYGTDVDLYVFRGRKLVGRSLGHGASERVDLPRPSAGRYRVRLRLVAAPGSGPLPAQFDSYVVPEASAERAAVQPTDRGVEAGTPALVRLSWPERPAGERWLGQVQWSDGGTGSAVTNLSGD